MYSQSSGHHSKFPDTSKLPDSLSFPYKITKPQCYFWHFPLKIHHYIAKANGNPEPITPRGTNFCFLTLKEGKIQKKSCEKAKGGPPGDQIHGFLTFAQNWKKKLGNIRRSISLCICRSIFSKNTSNGLYKVSTSSCPGVLMCPEILNDVRSFEDPYIYNIVISCFLRLLTNLLHVVILVFIIIIIVVVTPHSLHYPHNGKYCSNSTDKRDDGVSDDVARVSARSGPIHNEESWIVI